MKGYCKLFPVAALATVTVFFTGALVGRALAEEQQKAPAAAQVQESENTEYSEEEYNAYEAASKEPDFSKRATMLLDFIQKYPKSTLMTYIDYAYNNLLRECSDAKKYDLLEPLAEKWLKVRPNKVETIAYIAKAAENLGHDQKCAECLEEIYGMQPSGTLAYDIFKTYERIKNQAKMTEWAEKIFKMPEFDADYALRYSFVLRYMEGKNLPKAAEYAQLTIKSADLVKDPNAETKESLRKVRRACNHIMGLSLLEKDKFAEAIPYFQKALKAERYGEGYYWIGHCQERQGQDRVEDAILSYAKAELQNDDYSAKSKDRLEQLYKALHNNTTIGIEKVYRKAKEELQLEK